MKISFEVNVDGYKFVRYGLPKKGELFLNGLENPKVESARADFEYVMEIIVELEK